MALANAWCVFVLPGSLWSFHPQYGSRSHSWPAAGCRHGAAGLLQPWLVHLHRVVHAWSWLHHSRPLCYGWSRCVFRWDKSTWLYFLYYFCNISVILQVFFLPFFFWIPILLLNHDIFNVTLMTNLLLKIHGNKFMQNLVHSSIYSLWTSNVTCASFIYQPTHQPTKPLNKQM